MGDVFELLRRLNKYIDDEKLEKPESQTPAKLAALRRGVTVFREMGGVMGLFRQPPAEKQAGGDDELVGKLMGLLIELRAESRKKKDFATADQIRKRLAEIGVMLEDRPGGTEWTVSSVTDRILGIDPGLNITGYGVLEIGGGPPRLCEAGVVRGKSRGSLTGRLLEIHQGVADVIAALRPAVMALEQLYSHYARPADGDPHGPCPGRDLPGGGPGGHPRRALRLDAGQADPHRRRPGRQAADAAGHPARTAPAATARTARRCRRPGRGTVPLLLERQTGKEMN